MMDGAAQVGLAVDGTVRRKRFSVEQKQQIIRAAFEPGASVARVAREYGLNANQVFRWMKLRERGLLVDRPREGARLLPVRITEESALEKTPEPAPLATRSGSIHIEIADKAVLTVEAGADAQLLRVALECLLG
jgi:transposase